MFRDRVLVCGCFVGKHAWVVQATGGRPAGDEHALRRNAASCIPQLRRAGEGGDEVSSRSGVDGEG